MLLGQQGDLLPARQLQSVGEIGWKMVDSSRLLGKSFLPWSSWHSATVKTQYYVWFMLTLVPAHDLSMVLDPCPTSCISFVSSPHSLLETSF